MQQLTLTEVDQVDGGVRMLEGSTVLLGAISSGYYGLAFGPGGVAACVGAYLVGFAIGTYLL